jgi:membrane-associated HD superfamily phosphohydrolase
MNLSHLSTNTPASEVSSASFDDGSVSADLEAKSLDDILRNSPAAKMLGLESLPEEDESVPNPDEESEEEQAQENDSEAENDLDENKESTDSEEENAAEDDTSTQNAELPTEEDIDWEYQVPVTVDGKTEYVSLEEIRKGYSTDKHLSQKGRELGELKKQIETERNEKLQEVMTLATVINEELTATETKLSGEYHKIKGDIDKAREEGDTYTARELKEKLEEVQEKYWAARNKREASAGKVAEQLKAQQAEQQQALLKAYEDNITKVIPDYSDKVAGSIREFAIKEGIPEQLLDVIYDVNVVKFINDYRKLKTAKETGEVKRKAAPSVKSVPTKNGLPAAKKAQQATTENRSKVLSGQGSKQDELDFLKRISSVSKKL